MKNQLILNNNRFIVVQVLPPSPSFPISSWLAGAPAGLSYSWLAGWPVGGLASHLAGWPTSSLPGCVARAAPANLLDGYPASRHAGQLAGPWQLSQTVLPPLPLPSSLPPSLCPFLYMASMGTFLVS